MGFQVPMLAEIVQAPGNNDLNWDAQSTVTQRDAYYHTNVAHDYIRNIDSGPALSYLDTALPALIEADWGQCNAYWDGQGITYYAAGGPCPSIARIADVVYHEYGHGVTQFTYWPVFGPSDIHEGLSDYFACTIKNDK